MKILVISQYYWPEQFQITDVCEGLAARGHSVTVLTGLPNYPEGKIFEGYRRGESRREERNGVDVVRVPLLPRGADPLHLALNYHSFERSASEAVRLLPGDFDVVYVPQLSPVMMVGPAALYKELHGAPLLVHCIDLWPESLKTVLGERGGAVVAAYGRVSRRLYNSADEVAVTSPAFMDYLESEHGVPRERMRYVPQFADEAYLEMDFDEPHEGVVFTVAGNMGRAQDIPVILRAVEMMRHEGGFTVEFVGDGSCFEDTRAYVGAHHLGSRVLLHGRKPYDELPAYYARTDAFLLALNGDSWVGTTVPARLQGYMAVGKPVVAAARGGAADVVRESGCGVAVPAGDSAALAAAMDAYLDDPSSLAGCGERGRAYFAAHFTKKRHIDAVETELMALVTARKGC